jgi:hypothetical protein
MKVFCYLAGVRRRRIPGYIVSILSIAAGMLTMPGNSSAQCYDRFTNSKSFAKFSDAADEVYKQQWFIAELQSSECTDSQPNWSVGHSSWSLERVAEHVKAKYAKYIVPLVPNAGVTSDLSVPVLSSENSQCAAARKLTRPTKAEYVFLPCSSIVMTIRDSSPKPREPGKDNDGDYLLFDSEAVPMLHHRVTITDEPSGLARQIDVYMVNFENDKGEALGAGARVVWIIPGHTGMDRAQRALGIQHEDALENGTVNGVWRPFPGMHYLAGRLAAKGLPVFIYNDPTMEVDTYDQLSLPRVLADVRALNEHFLSRYSLDLVGISGGGQRTFVSLLALPNVKSAYIEGAFAEPWTQLRGYANLKLCNSKTDDAYTICPNADFYNIAFASNFSWADISAFAIANGVRMAFSINRREDGLSKFFRNRVLVPQLATVTTEFELAGDDPLGRGGYSQEASGHCHEFYVDDYYSFLARARINCGENRGCWIDPTKRPSIVAPPVYCK